MRRLIFGLALLGAGVTATQAQDSIPNLNGTWSGKSKTIVGADMDGSFQITLISPDRMEKCYTQNATSPSNSIVATCHMMDRVNKTKC
jgi:hypothetical protein